MLFYLIIVLQGALAQDVELRWFPARFPLGECVRMHRPSQGDAYVEKVKPEVCRPEQLSNLWLKGTCYEVDRASGGQQYGVRVGPRDCAPAKFSYEFLPDRQECWRVDGDRPHEGYREKVKVDECRPPEPEIRVRFAAEAPIGGRCEEVHVAGPNRWRRVVDFARCRPKETSFTWHSQGELKGDCWEVALSGPAEFSAKAKVDACKPAQTTTRFERRDEKSGACWEVDAATLGLQWAKPAKIERCRPQ